MRTAISTCFWWQKNNATLPEILKQGFKLSPEPEVLTEEDSVSRSRSRIPLDLFIECAKIVDNLLLAQ